MDQDGYPTEETIRRIQTWPSNDSNGALDFVTELWHQYGQVWHNLNPEQYLTVGGEPHNRFLRLATGGWSGNEDLIDALSENCTIWSMTWCMSGRGGLYIFKYTEE